MMFNGKSYLVDKKMNDINVKGAQNVKYLGIQDNISALCFNCKFAEVSPTSQLDIKMKIHGKPSKQADQFLVKQTLNINK